MLVFFIFGYFEGPNNDWLFCHHRVFNLHNFDQASNRFPLLSWAITARATTFCSSVSSTFNLTIPASSFHHLISFRILSSASIQEDWSCSIILSSNVLMLVWIFTNLSVWATWFLICQLQSIVRANWIEVCSFINLVGVVGTPFCTYQYPKSPIPITIIPHLYQHSTSGSRRNRRLIASPSPAKKP